MALAALATSSTVAADTQASWVGCTKLACALERAGHGQAETTPPTTLVFNGDFNWFNGRRQLSAHQ
jgi:hypothetical protein